MRLFSILVANLCRLQESWSLVLFLCSSGGSPLYLFWEAQNEEVPLCGSLLSRDLPLGIQLLRQPQTLTSMASVQWGCYFFPANCTGKVKWSCLCGLPFFQGLYPFRDLCPLLFRNNSVLKTDMRPARRVFMPGVWKKLLWHREGYQSLRKVVWASPRMRGPARGMRNWTEEWRHLEKKAGCSLSEPKQSEWGRHPKGVIITVQ